MKRGKVAEFQPNIIMRGHSPSAFILRAVSNVHTNDLEQTLLVRHRRCMYVGGACAVWLNSVFLPSQEIVLICFIWIFPKVDLVGNVNYVKLLRYCNCVMSCGC